MHSAALKSASEAEGGAQPGVFSCSSYRSPRKQTVPVYWGSKRYTVHFSLHRAKGGSLHPALSASTLTLLRPPEGQALCDTEWQWLPARGAGTATAGEPGPGARRSRDS